MVGWIPSKTKGYVLCLGMIPTWHEYNFALFHFPGCNRHHQDVYIFSMGSLQTFICHYQEGVQLKIYLWFQENHSKLVFPERR